MKKLLALLLLIPFAVTAAPFVKEKEAGYSVYFDTDSSEVAPRHVEDLTNASVVKVLEISAFADERDTDLHNRLLSERRALAVYNVVGPRAFGANIFSFGESMPVNAGCKTAKCLQNDRRADVTLIINVFSPIWKEGKPVPGALHANEYFTYPLGSAAP